MLVGTFDNSYSVDQQQKILQEIQLINKKLHSNPYSINNQQHKIPLKNYNINQNHHNYFNMEDKYFSQNCDNLFSDSNNPITQRNQISFQDSLFSSKNSLLLAEYDKEIKNFKQFDTSLISESNIQKINIGNNIKAINGKKNQSDRSKEIKENKLMKKIPSTHNLANTNQVKSQSPILSRSTSKPVIKTIAQTKINKYIQNKENILPASNLQPRKKSYLKQVQKKIRFETQPDYNSRKEEFLEYQQKNSHLLNQNLKTKSKYNSKNTLECTFKPNILKKSSEIAQNLQPSFERLTQDPTVSKSQARLPYKTKQQLTTKKYSAKRLDQLSQPRKLKTIAQNQEPKYDFRPSLSKKSLQQMANCTMDVASRNKLWLQQRQAKMARLKEEQLQKKQKQESCSYVPKITPYKGDREVNLSRYTKQGICSYFERVSMTKQKQQTIEKKKPPAREQMRESNVNMKKKTYQEAVKELHKKIMAIHL